MHRRCIRIQFSETHVTVNIVDRLNALKLKIDKDILDPYNGVWNLEFHIASTGNSKSTLQPSHNLIPTF